MAIEYGPKLGQLIHAELAEEHYDALTQLLRAIDALVQATVIDDGVNTPPFMVNDGDCYIVGDSPTGDWSGWEFSIARWSAVISAWEFYAPRPGWVVWSDASNKHLRYQAIPNQEWVDFLTPAPARMRVLVEALGFGYIENSTPDFNFGGSAPTGVFGNSGLCYGNEKSSGKRYFEIELVAEPTAGQNLIIGLQQPGLIGAYDEATHDISAYNLYGGVFRFDSKFYGNEGALLLDGAGAAGSATGFETFKFAVDLDAGKLWYRINNGAWFGGGSPDTGTGGLTIGPAGGVSYVPVIGMLEAGMASYFYTLPGSTVSAPPSGFVTWDSDTTPGG